MRSKNGIIIRNYREQKHPGTLCLACHCHRGIFAASCGFFYSSKEFIQLNRFKISTNFEDLDINLVYSFISNSYWAKNIPFERIQQCLDKKCLEGVIDILESEDEELCNA